MSNLTNLPICGTVSIHQAVSDLQRWLDSRWVAGFTRGSAGLTSRLQVLCRAGEYPMSEPDTEAAAMICPIRARANSGLGALIAFGPKRDGSRYTGDDRAFAEDYCRQLGASATSRETEDTELAREMYERLDHLSCDYRSLGHGRSEGIPGLEYGGQCRRAGGLGGDFYDLIPRDNRELTLAIGNIAAKGTPGTLILGGAMASFRALASCGEELPRIAAELNRMMWEVAPEGAYSSFFGARINVAGHCLEYVNAGHEPALLIRAGSGRCERLDTTGAVLGLSRRSTYPERTVAFEPGDLLVAFTDGIAEAAAPLGIVRFVRETPAAGVQELATRILEATGEKRCSGDRTVVLVRARDAGEAGVNREVAPVRAMGFSVAA